MTLEKILERKATQKIKAAGGQSIKLLARTGLPDRLFLMPAGRIWFVEFKSENGRLSALQVWWGEKLISLGFSWKMINSEENLKSLFKEMGL